MINILRNQRTAENPKEEKLSRGTMPLESPAWPAAWDKQYGPQPQGARERERNREKEGVRSPAHLRGGAREAENRIQPMHHFPKRRAHQQNKKEAETVQRQHPPKAHTPESLRALLASPPPQPRPFSIWNGLLLSQYQRPPPYPAAPMKGEHRETAMPVDMPPMPMPIPAMGAAAKPPMQPHGAAAI